MRQVKIGSENISTYVMLVDEVDGSPKTGYAIASCYMQYTRNAQETTTSTQATELSLVGTAHTDYRGKQIDSSGSPGLYRFDWPDEAFESGNGDTQVTLVVKGAGIQPAIESIQLDAPSAADIADAVWDEDLDPAHITAGTAGKAMIDVEVDTGTSIPGVLGTPVGASISAELADIDTRLPSSLDGGYIKSKPQSIGDVAAAKIGTLAISSVDTQTSNTLFTLSTGDTSNLDDTYNGCTIVIEDYNNPLQRQRGVIKDYVGSTRTVELETAPGVFDISPTDIVYILASSPTLDDIQTRLPSSLDGGHIKSKPMAIHDTVAAKLGTLAISEVANVTSNTEFTLDAATTSALDDVYNGRTIVIEDANNSYQRQLGVVKDYTGATKSVELESDPGVFTIAATDIVYILATSYTGAVADAVWDTTASAHTDVGTMGKIMNNMEAEHGDNTLMAQSYIASISVPNLTFTLAGGSTVDNTYVGCTIIVRDAGSSESKAVGVIASYDGGTKTVTLAYDPNVFDFAVNDLVTIIAAPNKVSGGIESQIADTVWDAASGSHEDTGTMGRILSVLADEHGDNSLLYSGPITDVTSNTEFTINNASSLNNTYVGCTAIIRASSESKDKAVGIVSGYVGGGEVTLAPYSSPFTITLGDIVTIVAAPNSFSPQRQTDISESVWETYLHAGSVGAGLKLYDTNLDTISIQTDTTSILADTAILKDRLPVMPTKGVALNNFPFLMVSSLDHVTPIPSLATITASRSIDGGAFASLSSPTVTEVANGLYKVNLSAADLNGDTVVLRLVATGADDRIIVLVTQPTG